MSMIYVVVGDGEQKPYSEEAFRLMWQQRRLAADALYWRDGMADWKTVGEFFAGEPAIDPAVPPPLDGAGLFRYVKDPRAVTLFAITMVWVLLCTEVVSLLSDFNQLALLNSDFSDAQATANDTRQQFVGIAYLVVSLVSAVGFLRWFYRASVNSRGFNARGMQYAAGWTIGGFFVPFLNLVRPFQVMKEIWQISGNPLAWRKETGAVLVGWWWGLWLVGNVLGQIIMRMPSDSLESLHSMTVVSIVSGFQGIAQHVVVLLLIKQIADRQARLVGDLV